MACAARMVALRCVIWQPVLVGSFPGLPVPDQNVLALQDAVERRRDTQENSTRFARPHRHEFAADFFEPDEVAVRGDAAVAGRHGDARQDEPDRHRKRIEILAILPRARAQLDFAVFQIDRSRKDRIPARSEGDGQDVPPVFVDVVGLLSLIEMNMAKAGTNCRNRARSS